MREFVKARAAVVVLMVGLVSGAAWAADAEKQPVEKQPVTVDMSNGGVTFSSGDNSLTLGAWIQFNWIGDDKENFDADTSGSGVGEEDGFSTQFKIPRLRLYVLGTMYRPWLKYKFEFEFSNTSGEGDNKIKDGYIELAKYHWTSVRLGQYKVPFSLQELTPDIKQMFVERAITDAKFAVARDLGVMVSGLSEKHLFGYSAGVFNGGGESHNQDDQGLLYAARAWFDPLGEYKLSEGAIENPETMVLHFGAAVRTGEASRGTATPGVFEDPDNETAYGAEFAWRWKRLWATGEYFLMTDELKNPVEAPDVDSSGYLVEVTGIVIQKAFELGARYAEIDPDDDTSDDKVSEIRGVAAWYLKGHNLKFVLDAGEIRYEKNVGALSAIALRNIGPLGTRLGPPQEYSDKQYRLLAQLAF